MTVAISLVTIDGRL